MLNLAFLFEPRWLLRSTKYGVPVFRLSAIRSDIVIPRFSQSYLEICELFLKSRHMFCVEQEGTVTLAINGQPFYKKHDNVVSMSLALHETDVSFKTAGRWKRYKSFRRKSFFASTFQRKLRWRLGLSVRWLLSFRGQSRALFLVKAIQPRPSVWLDEALMWDICF